MSVSYTHLRDFSIQYVQAEIRINLCYRRQKVKIKEFLGKVYRVALFSEAKAMECVCFGMDNN